MTYVQNIAIHSAVKTASPFADLAAHYEQIDVELRLEDQALWCYLKPQGRPAFTEDMLSDLHRVQDFIVRLAAGREHDAHTGLRWVVLASRTPGVFNLGGDLALFSEMIRSRDKEGLRHYAHSCVEVGYLNSAGYKGDVITVGLAQGDALGGGFESLLSCDVLIAERRARFGLPEILFNLFPGMGAHPFLGRRMSPAAAQRIILSGEMYTAEAMHAAGVVDVLVEDGTGELAAREYIRANGPRGNAHAAVYNARRRLNPVTLEDLRDVADIWVDAAMGLTEQDLRRMSHLVAAQDRVRRLARAA